MTLHPFHVVLVYNAAKEVNEKFHHGSLFFKGFDTRDTIL